jgi:hypothetical protein
MGQDQAFRRRYTKLFCEPVADGDYTEYLSGQARHVRPYSVTGRTHSRLLHLDIETPDAAPERFKAAGERRRRPSPEATDSWIATLADPDDNYFQLMSPMIPDQGG